MSRYTAPEDEFEPGSNGAVLRNYYHVTDAKEIQTLETMALAHAQERFYATFEPEHRFSVKDILDMHRDWLSPIYPFAGHLRKINLSKGGYWFAAAQFLESNLAKFESEVLSVLTPCKPGEVAKSLAIVHGEFITIHPFREGNGRLGRWLADAMAAQAGMPLPDYHFEPDDATGLRAEYLKGVKAAMALDFEPLTRFFSAALERAVLVAKDRIP